MDRAKGWAGNPASQTATQGRFVFFSPCPFHSTMISRSHSLPRLPSSSFSPSPPRLARSQSFSGAIHGSPVQPSAPIDNAAPEQAVVVPAHAQPPVVFDLGNLPPELQQLVVVALCNPHEACTLEQLQKALQAFKAASEVNKLFKQAAWPFLHATFLRLFGLGRIKGASFKSLPLGGLPRILEGIVARSGLSGLQCLSDLVNGSLGEQPDLARQAYTHWRQMGQRAQATTKLPYDALPTLIAVRLGQMLREAVAPEHVMRLMHELLGMAKAKLLSDDRAMPALIEVALVVKTQELASGCSFRGKVGYMNLGSDDVRSAMAARGGFSEDLWNSLNAVAEVLASQRAVLAEPLDETTVLAALNYLADCPYPLIGGRAEALDIIQRMDLGHNPHVEGPLARCAEKRASVRLLGPMPQ